LNAKLRVITEKVEKKGSPCNLQLRVSVKSAKDNIKQCLTPNADHAGSWLS